MSRTVQSPAPLVLAGSANLELSRALEGARAVPFNAVSSERFPDGERHVELLESARGRSAYLLQSLGAPVGEAVLELLLLADACRRAGTKRRIGLIPYLGYARQDRRQREGEALGIRVVADMLAQGRFERLVFVDLHASASEGCFDASVDHLTAVPLLADAVRSSIGQSVIIAPDAGAAKMAHQYAKLLDLPVATLQKSRRSARDVEVVDIVGDVSGRRPLVIDDMISSGGTIAAALEAVIRRGAVPPGIVVTTHLIPGAGAATRFSKLPIERVVTTDSLPASEDWTLPVERVSLGPLLAKVINNLESNAPLSDLLSTR